MKRLEQFLILTATVAAVGLASSIVSQFYLVTPNANFLSVVNMFVTTILYFPLGLMLALINITGIKIELAGWMGLLLLNSATWAGVLMLVTKLVKRKRTKADVNQLIPRWAYVKSHEEKEAANS